MDLTLRSMNLPVLMDILALAASTVLIIVLVVNRWRYGRLVLSPTPKTSFPSEIKLQMVSQQSQRCYANIQRALRREFEGLQRMAGSEAVVTDASIASAHAPRALANPMRAGHHEEAARLIRNGVDPDTIAERCGLSRGEIDLMVYMQHKRS